MNGYSISTFWMFLKPNWLSDVSQISLFKKCSLQLIWYIRMYRDTPEIAYSYRFIHAGIITFQTDAEALSRRYCGTLSMSATQTVVADLFSQRFSGVARIFRMGGGKIRQSSPHPFTSIPSPLPLPSLLSLPSPPLGLEARGYYPGNLLSMILHVKTCAL